MIWVGLGLRLWVLFGSLLLPQSLLLLSTSFFFLSPSCSSGWKGDPATSHRNRRVAQDLFTVVQAYRFQPIMAHNLGFVVAPLAGCAVTVAVAGVASAISLALSLSRYGSRSLPSHSQMVVGARRLGHSHHRSPAKPPACSLSLPFLVG